jgi:hypothetical protein
VQDRIVDLITNLLHYGQQVNLNTPADDLLRMAKNHYTAEQHEGSGSIGIIPGIIAPNAISLDDRELATVLAALRNWCSDTIDSAISLAIDDIATNGGTLTPLDAEEINSLCERLNSR